jgi:hypothetical protein
MTYSCTDLADTVLEAAAALALTLKDAPTIPGDCEDFSESPSMQADYILAVMDRAEETINTLRARQTYTLAELRNGTGFRPGARFIEVQS